MPDTAGVIPASIYHRRLAYKANRFRYSMLYLALPLSQLDSLKKGWILGVNSPGLLSFWNKDHGDRTNTDLRIWVQSILKENNIDDADGEVVLVTLPRILGYVFNPVSFWLCFRGDGALRAVVAEVNNTFGETHHYVCAGDDDQLICAEDTYIANKEFHVSPFMERTGFYRFKFNIEQDKLAVRINYFDENEQLLLQTSIGGPRLEWNTKNLLTGWRVSPLMSLKAIVLIHWQALRLKLKSIKFVSKPPQHSWIQTRALRENHTNSGLKNPKTL